MYVCMYVWTYIRTYVCMYVCMYGCDVQAGPALGGAGHNWEQFRSTQVPSQLAPRVCRIGRGAQLGAISPIGLRPALCTSIVKQEKTPVKIV